MSARGVARAAVEEALRSGASAADAQYAEGDSVEVRVRDGAVEQVEESRSRGVSVRAFRGRRVGLAYTNDVTHEGVARAAHRAADLASVAAEDEAGGPPDASDLGALANALDVVDPETADYGVETWRDAAREAEAAAKSHAGIAASEGARAGGGRARVAIASSGGFDAEHEQSVVWTMVSVIATGTTGERQRGSFGQSGPHRNDLPTPRAVGDEAARRALSRVGWTKPPTGKFPVILAPEIARELAGTLAQAASAGAVFRGMTFLARSLGEVVGSTALTLVDDPTLPRRAGSRPFDGEGVRARRTVVFDRGRLASWLSNSYAARRTGTRTTGNAARGAAADTSVAPSNLVLAPGTRPPEALIADAGEGLYVEDLFHFGVNLTSGAWSRGGSGRWIVGGRLAHPVQELTVAGDLPSILAGFREAANDLEWSGGCAAPTVRIDGLTVAAG